MDEAGITRWVEAFIARESQPEVVDQWVDRIDEQIFAEHPDIAADAVLLRLIRTSTRTHWLAFLSALSEPARDFHLVQPAKEMAAELARRGHPITVLFGIYRVAQLAVWDYATTIKEHGFPEGVDEATALVFFWSRAGTWLDASMEASVEVFQVEEDRLRRGNAAMRLEAVRSILDGASTDTRELSAHLGGHPLSTYNTALLLHTEEHSAIAALGTAATELARRMNGRLLVIDPGGRDLWAWSATRSEPDLKPLTEAADWLTERAISVAVGTPGEGLAGFAQSHHEAQAAQRLAFEMTAARPVTLFPDVELLALISGSPEGARRFAVRTLGGLADAAEGPTRLRQTLQALLAHGSVDAAAQALSVHKNTVRYRVNQAEELLGYPVSDAPTEVEIALRYYELFMAAPPPQRRR